MSDHLAQKVLVVDDDETELFLLRYALEGAGFAVAEANSAEAGLLVCGDSAPDAVVLDATLPGMDGFEMCRLLRRRPAYDHTPIMILTGLVDPQCRSRAFKAGADDFMTKTTDWSGIVSRIRSLLSGTQPLQPHRC